MTILAYEISVSQRIYICILLLSSFIRITPVITFLILIVDKKQCVNLSKIDTGDGDEEDEEKEARESKEQIEN